MFQKKKFLHKLLQSVGQKYPRLGDGLHKYESKLQPFMKVDMNVNCWTTRGQPWKHSQTRAKTIVSYRIESEFLWHTHATLFPYLRA